MFAVFVYNTFNRAFDLFTSSFPAVFVSFLATGVTTFLVDTDFDGMTDAVFGLLLVDVEAVTSVFFVNLQLFSLGFDDFFEVTGFAGSADDDEMLSDFTSFTSTALESSLESDFARLAPTSFGDSLAAGGPPDPDRAW
jgi:hypothetical protein